MTIILSVVTAEYAVQVSDRLLTQEVPNRAGTPIRYDPWDPTANKSVVVLGRDGLFTMGYSGPAHISAPRLTGGLRKWSPVRSSVPTRSGPTLAPFGS